MNSKGLDLDFYDILGLDVSVDLRDELILGYMHNLNLTDYLQVKGIRFDTIRSIRLCLEHNVPTYYIDSNLSNDILLSLFELYSKGRTLDSSGLAKYFSSGSYKLRIESSTFAKLVGLALSDYRFDELDFVSIPLATVDLYVGAVEQGIDVVDFQNTYASSNYEYFKFLLSLRQSDIDISPFINGTWSEEQVTAVIRGRNKISVVDFVSHYINQNFTEGQIEYCIRAVDYDCLDLLSSLDEDGYPLYNEYQMYQLLEGARFGLDYMSYANPNLSDFEMNKRRNILFNQRDAETRGSLSSQLSVERIVTKL